MPTVSFQGFQRLELSPDEMVVGPAGSVQDAFLGFPYEIADSLPADGRDLVVLIGDGKRPERIAELADLPGRIVVVFTPYDVPIDREHMPEGGTLPDNFVAAYGCNMELAGERAVALPLGVRANKLTQLLQVKRSHRGGRRGLAYGSFATDRRRRTASALVGPSLRARLAERLRDAPWAKMDTFRTRRDDPEQLLEYYRQIAGHKFTLSPPGYGIDCYRTWESLYLGAIPIVATSVAMREFAGLPILFTEDYSELSEDYLQECWERLSRGTYDIGKLLRSHYREHFLRSLSALDAPRFICWQGAGFPGEQLRRSLEARA